MSLSGPAPRGAVRTGPGGGPDDRDGPPTPCPPPGSPTPYAPPSPSGTPPASAPMPALAEAATPQPLPDYDRAWLFTAPSADASVPRLRHAVRDLLAREEAGTPPATLDGLQLIVSELVTNAVRHAAVLSPRITLEIAVGPAWVRVAVGDDHPYRPKALVADPGRTGGRGLLLVEAIAAEAGGRCDVEHTPAGGKIVWAALPLRPRPAA